MGEERATGARHAANSLRCLQIERISIDVGLLRHAATLFLFTASATGIGDQRRPRLRAIGPDHRGGCFPFFTRHGHFVAGFILYLTDPQPEDGDVSKLREALRQSRGPGNFRNLFVHSPNEKKDGLQLIPVSELAAKDEFTGIKSVTRDDMLASLRTPPQLLGIVPQNSGGFGSIREAAMVWSAMELAPLQTRMTAVNEWLGQDVIAFDPFELAPPA